MSEDRPQAMPGAEDEGGVGPLPGGGYPVPEPPTNPGSTRERWLWTALVVATGLFIFGLMVVGGSGGVRPDLEQVSVSDVLSSGQLPADRYGSTQMNITGWFVQVTGSCDGDTAGSAPSGWLAATCPVRVLLPAQPGGPLSQTDLQRTGLRLAAPTGEPFPPQTTTGAGTAGLEELVFTGHFADPAADACQPARATLCRNTFVVTGYTGLIR